MKVNGGRVAYVVALLGGLVLVLLGAWRVVASISVTALSVPLSCGSVHTYLGGGDAGKDGMWQNLCLPALHNAAILGIALGAIGVVAVVGGVVGWFVVEGRQRHLVGTQAPPTSLQTLRAEDGQ